MLGVGGGGSGAQQQAFQDYLNSTNYQFQLGQGEQGIEYANAPAFNSGATAKALNNYAQGQAGSALQGYESMLMGGSQLGAQSGTALGQLNTGASEQQSANLLAAAGVQGSAGLAGANSISNALKGVTSGLSSFGGGNALSGFGGSGGNPSAGTFNYQPVTAPTTSPSTALAGFNW